MTRTRIVVIGTDTEGHLDALVRGRFDIQRVATPADALNLPEPKEVVALMVALPMDANEGHTLHQLRLAFRQAHLLATVGQDEAWRMVEAVGAFDIDRCLTTPLSAEECLPALEAAAQSFELQRLDYRAYGTGISRLNRRILCVDDELDILQYYESVLAEKPESSLAGMTRRRRRRRGGEEAPAPAPRPRNSLAPFELTLASSGEEAVELVMDAIESGKPFAAGFFDMKMPGGIDGLETIRRIRAIDPNLKCSVATAYTDRPMEEIQAAFTDYADWMYFNKPFTSGELLQAACNQVSRWNGTQGQVNLARFVRKLQLLLGRQGTGSTGAETINILSLICQRTLTEILQIDGWGMLLKDGRTHDFVPLVHHGVSEIHQAPLFKALTQHVSRGEERHIFSPDDAPADLAPSFAAMDIGQLVSLPLEGDNDPLGLLFTFVHVHRSKFSRQEVELTMRLAQEISQALQILSRRQAFSPQARTGFPLPGYHVRDLEDDGGSQAS